MCESYKKLSCELKKVDVTSEKEIKCFLKKLKNACFEIKDKNKCKKLSKKETCKIIRRLKPFIEVINNEKEENFNKFTKYVRNDPEFQRLDGVFKAEGGQTKENYDNLISYFKGKLPWLRRRNGDDFTFMLADDNCVPMYNSSKHCSNNYKNYSKGKIELSTRESYENLTFAFKNVYSSESKSTEYIFFERVGTNTGVIENFRDRFEVPPSTVYPNPYLNALSRINIEFFP